MSLPIGYIPQWEEIIFWGCITLIAFSILGLVLGLLDDLIGQRINKKRLKRYIVIFLPPAVISFFAAGFSAAVHEAEYYPWDTFLLYVIMCLVFWYAGAVYHNFIIEERKARCPKCEARLLCGYCDKEIISYLGQMKKE